VQSLRFRVPAIFLAGITVAALVTGGFALQLFLDYNEDKTLGDLFGYDSVPAVALYERIGFQREPYDFQTIMLP
jgi:hypothetical protein